MNENIFALLCFIMLYHMTSAGFMLENTSWGETDSRTIQFIIPPVRQPLDHITNDITVCVCVCREGGGEGRRSGVCARGKSGNGQVGAFLRHLRTNMP